MINEPQPSLDAINRALADDASGVQPDETVTDSSLAKPETAHYTDTLGFPIQLLASAKPVMLVAVRQISESTTEYRYWPGCEVDGILPPTALVPMNTETWEGSYLNHQQAGAKAQKILDKLRGDLFKGSSRKLLRKNRRL